MNSGRVILHIDLDCFYCQVEQKRLGIPRDVPAAVQQWEGLIAINYAARAAGITRHMRVREALQKVPELKCMHVQTIGGESGQEGNEGAVNPGLIHPNDRSLQKACLERYRRACAEILKVLHQTLPQAIIEKASIDEVYVDVTHLVEKELKEREEAETGDAFAWGSIVLDGPLDPESEFDRRLSIGASLACRLRGAVFNHLGFTSSAGIAGNKLLAKVASAKNKPNKQTVVPARAVLGLMATLPLKKLRNFGGKLGAELETLGACTAGQVAALPFQTLEQRFGERARWILNAVNGINDEPVQVRELPKSMLAAKSFEATADSTALARWLGILAEELAERMVVDAEENLRPPRLLVLSYRQKGHSAGRSKSGPMPRASGGPSAAMLKDAAVALLQKCPDAIPCCNLGLSATEFVAAPTDERAAITRFFVPVAQTSAAEPPPRAGTPEPPPHQAAPLPKPRPASHRNTITSMFGRAAAAAPEPRQQNRPPDPPQTLKAKSYGSSARDTPPPQASGSVQELELGPAGRGANDVHAGNCPDRPVTGMLRDAATVADNVAGSVMCNAAGDAATTSHAQEVEAKAPLGCSGLQDLGLVSPQRSLPGEAAPGCSQRIAEAGCRGGVGLDGCAERLEADSSGMSLTVLGAACGRDSPGQTAPVAGSGGGAKRDIGGGSSAQQDGQASVSGDRPDGETRIASTSREQQDPCNEAKQSGERAEQPGNNPGSRESGEHAGQPGERAEQPGKIFGSRESEGPEGQPGAEVAGLEGVDLQEQKRILRDIWVRSRTGQNLNPTGSETGTTRKEDSTGGGTARKSARRDGGERGVASKQPRISALFARAAARQTGQQS